MDGFQGREKEVVILTMVRSNHNKNLGFLVEKRRLNVAVTRAKRQLVLVCDSSTVSHDIDIGKFISYMRERGVVEEARTENLVLPSRSCLPSTATAGVKKERNKTSEAVKVELPSLERVVGLDCEMVGTGERGEESLLARVSIVDGRGVELLDEYVSTEEEITDYRTEKSGIRPENLVGARKFEDVRHSVVALLEGKIIVGHGLSHDFDVLEFYPPGVSIRDTATYRGFRKSGRTPSLKALAKEVLKVKIQSGEHSSVEDARTALNLYLKVRQDWEGMVQSKGKTNINPERNSSYKSLGVSKSPSSNSKENKSVQDISRKMSAVCLSQPVSVGSKIERLKTLSPAHYFQDQDFTALLRAHPSNHNKLKKAQTEVEWAKIWLRIRIDRKPSRFDPNMTISEAFNQLSNNQLELWMRINEVKISNNLPNKKYGV